MSHAKPKYFFDCYYHYYYYYFEVYPERTAPGNDAIVSIVVKIQVE